MPMNENPVRFDDFFQTAAQHAPHVLRLLNLHDPFKLLMLKRCSAPPDGRASRHQQS